MSLGDCPECWDTPCECGHEYKTSPLPWLRKMRDLFDRIIRERESQEPKA